MNLLLAIIIRTMTFGSIVIMVGTTSTHLRIMFSLIYLQTTTSTPRSVIIFVWILANSLCTMFIRAHKGLGYALTCKGLGYALTRKGLG